MDEMDRRFAALGFGPADILLPWETDMTRWSVVACDQYTSEPAYWQRVEEFVGRAPSTLRLILPESCLEGPDVEGDIQQINLTMTRYLRDGVFREYPHAMIYVERTLHSGEVRRGLVGMVDLEQYDYEPGSGSLIRATEGTVLSRIPPRVAVRKNAPIELPHVMLLADDPERTVIEPLTGVRDRLERVYDFDLMEKGGRVTGWLLDREEQDRVAAALAALADPVRFRARYRADGPVMLFAVGDGNHSLATAKECYERQKKLLPPDRWAELPARYALVELNNLYDDSLEFEPIHRVVFGVEPEELLDTFDQAARAGRFSGGPDGQHLLFYVCAGREGWESGEGCLVIERPACRLEVGTLQNFLDEYLPRHPGSRVDYVHGADVARRLAREREDAVAFLLPAMEKEQLFPAVIRGGVLPRKTFSMGEAHDKRFYLEARRIRD